MFCSTYSASQTVLKCLKVEIIRQTLISHHRNSCSKSPETVFNATWMRGTERNSGHPVWTLKNIQDVLVSLLLCERCGRRRGGVPTFSPRHSRVPFKPGIFTPPVNQMFLFLSGRLHLLLTDCCQPPTAINEPGSTVWREHRGNIFICFSIFLICRGLRWGLK